MEVSSHPVTSRHSAPVTWFLLSGLLVLRLPFLAGLSMYLRARPDWLGTTFEVATYVLTLCLVVWNLDNLADFHLDLISVVLILVFKPLETVLLAGPFPAVPLAFPHWPSLIIWACSVVTAGVLLVRHRILPGFHLRSILSLLLGVGVGLAGALVLALLPSRTGTKVPSYSWSTWALLGRAAAWIPYQMGYAALSEEPLFRGFLWGQLRRHGWQDWWILLFQTGLFMCGHLYYLAASPMSFWVTVPIGAAGLGLLAWRTRCISASIVAHGCVNAMSGPIGIALASLRV